MVPRSLSLPPDVIASHRPLAADARALRSAAGLRRKACAIALHVACFGLFGWTVVWPVLSPVVNGEFAREFEPALEALAGWAR